MSNVHLEYYKLVFSIVRHPALALDVSMLEKIMIACIILHNMIVEDERDTYAIYYDPRYDDPNEYEQAEPPSSSRRNSQGPFQFSNSSNRPANLETYMANRARVHDEVTHRALKSDLVEHLWLRYGESYNRQ
ncbi:uncharacterized protein LOC110699521 [Chenopodium quinoa]|uniref:uncharacterized protein LOC110699521 n=1 Tax=Chenopodium quinoa TaxID=63459 RepID=UPI000B799031|nr:uncharacterized protein LOC110699521 [Chenopodium quinoa]